MSLTACLISQTISGLLVQTNSLEAVKVESRVPPPVCEFVCKDTHVSVSPEDTFDVNKEMLRGKQKAEANLSCQ